MCLQSGDGEDSTTLRSEAYAIIGEMGLLTAEQREAILRIKRDYHRRGLLRDGLSLQIYRAVVDHGVRATEESQRHLRCDDSTPTR